MQIENKKKSFSGSTKTLDTLKNAFLAYYFLIKLQ